MKYLFAFLMMAQVAFANPQDLRPLNVNEILYLPGHVDVLAAGEPASYMPNHSAYLQQFEKAKAYLHAAEHFKKEWFRKCPRVMNIMSAQIYPPLPEARRVMFRQRLCYEMGFVEKFPPEGQSDFKPPY